MSYLVKNPSVISVTSLSVTLEWAKNHDMERRVRCCETTYQKGVKLCRKTFLAMSNRIDRPWNGQKTMTWKGVCPVVKLLETTYQKGVKLCRKTFLAMSNRIDRDSSLPKYYVTIQPQT